MKAMQVTIAVSVVGSNRGKAIIAMLVLAFVAVEAKAATYHVPADFNTIQAGIDAAGPGDRVIVSVGTYNENIDFSGKNITLTSINPSDWSMIEETVINGNSGSVVTFSGDETSACSLKGFTITGGDAHHGGGIRGNGTKATISHSIIRDNYARLHGGGITGSNGTISRCFISDNSTGSYGGGLSFCGGKITNCLVSGNSSHYSGGGIEECSGFIGNCTIVSNSCGGIRDYKGVITNCIVWGNKCAELFRSSPPTYSCIEGGYSGQGNISSDPMFVNASNDYRLQNSSPCIDTGTSSWSELFYSKDMDGKVRHLDGNNDGMFKSDMGAYEYGIVETPFIAVQPTKIDFIVAQDSIDFPQDELTIWNIGNGMLNWQINEDASWLSASPASGYSSGEADETTLTVDATGLSPGKYTCTLLVIDYNAAVSPVEVEINLYVYLDEGTPRYVPSQYPTIQIGIDFANEGDMVIVEPNTYNENIHFNGKNIIVTSMDPNDRTVMESTIIHGNGMDSVVTFAGSEDESCELTGFTITGGHSSFGGGVYGNAAHSTISRCVIRDNIADFSGGGISSCNGMIGRSIITNNSSNYTYYGGGGLYNCNGSISNCLISFNSADEGGGLIFSDASIANCTIVANRARLGGGLRHCRGKISNCIIWNNTSDQLSSSQVEYSCVQGGFSGIGNINSDPLFVDPVNKNYHLLANSPCIDAGNPYHIAALDESDLDGNKRIMGIIDMGAYEKTNFIKAQMKLTPRFFNTRSQGNYIKAHIDLPQHYIVGDVNTNTPAKLWPFGITSDYISVFTEGSVKIEIGFDRSDLISALYDGSNDGAGYITVIGSLIDGQKFYATDTFRIKESLEPYINIASHWLQKCNPPKWCDEADINQSGIVNFKDYCLVDGWHIQLGGE